VGAHHHDAGAQSGVPSQGFSPGESLSLTEVNGPKGLFGCYVLVSTAGVLPRRRKEGRGKKEEER